MWAFPREKSDYQPEGGRRKACCKIGNILYLDLHAGYTGRPIYVSIYHSDTKCLCILLNVKYTTDKR